MVKGFITLLLDIFVPPRRTERIVRSLTHHELATLLREGGLPYQDPRVTALVWEMKYYAHPRALALAAEILAPQVAECAAEEIGRPLLIPIPMHPVRRRERGHNPTALLCARVAQLIAGIEYAPHALRRIKNTPHQQGLERSVRLANLKDAMRADAAVRDRVCIVIDDVTTTGATLEEAKRALQAAGARSVHALALAS